MTVMIAEDDPLVRLFLGEPDAARLDKLWTEQRFVSRQPVAEHDYLPQFMGYTTQDTPKAFQQFFVDRKPLFQKHADEFLRRGLGRRARAAAIADHDLASCRRRFVDAMGRAYAAAGG